MKILTAIKQFLGLHLKHRPIKYVVGNLLELAPTFDVIAHGCNCFNSMSGGIAYQIAKKYPIVEAADDETVGGDPCKLGGFSMITFEDFIVLNAYTQYHPGANVDYDAIRLAMNNINKSFPNMSIGLPKIGAGIAGGDWDRIEKIIKEELVDMDITIVEFGG